VDIAATRQPGHHKEARIMRTPRRLPLAVTGATLALVMAGTVVASANGGRDGRPFDFGGPGGFAGRAIGPLGERFGLGDDGVIRSETIVDLGEAGFLTRRVDSGTVMSASETELAYTLANGEAATVSADEDTEVLTVDEVAADDDQPFRRRLLALEEIALSEIPADAEVVVWSESGDAGTFVAQRVVVQPAEDAADDAADEAAPADEVDPSASPTV
jgi:hypothetical protein